MPCLVRFDTEYAYGDAQDAWQELAASIAKSGVPALLGDVLLQQVTCGPGSSYTASLDRAPLTRAACHRGSSNPMRTRACFSQMHSGHRHHNYHGMDDDDDYHRDHYAEDEDHYDEERARLADHYDGDEYPSDDDDDGYRENQDLAARFDVSLEALPQFVYFPKGVSAAEASQHEVYEGAHEYDPLLRFLQARAGIWVGLPGQEEWLHDAAQRFVVSAEGEAREALITQVKEAGEGGGGGRGQRDANGSMRRACD